MNKKSYELIKNTIIIFLGKASSQFLSFLLLPLYTKYLETGDYGIVDLINTYVVLLVPVITLQFEMAIFRFLVDNRDNEDRKKEIISSVFSIIFIIIAILIVIYLILISIVSFKYSGLIILVIISHILISISLQTSRGLGNNIKYSIGCCINGITTVFLNIFFIIVKNMGAEGMLLSIIIANFVTFTYLNLSMRIYKYFNFKKIKKSLTKNMLKYSIPLIPNGISWWIVYASDRTIISGFLGVAANGIYAVSNKFSSIFIGVFNVFLLSWTESTSLHINDTDRDIFFSNTMNNVFKLFAVFCMIIITAIPLVFNVFIDSKYIEAYYYIPILMVAMLFNIIGGLNSGIYIAKKKTKQIMNTSLISAIINILINVLLIRRIGLYAAAISTLIAYAIMAIYRSFDLKKYINIKWNKKEIIKISVILIFISISYYINNIYLNIIGLVLVLIYSIKVYKTYVIKLYYKIKSVYMEK